MPLHETLPPPELADAIADAIPEGDDLTANAAALELLSVLYKRPMLWYDVKLEADEVPAGWRDTYHALRAIWERGADPDRAVLAAELKATTGHVEGINDERIELLWYGGGRAGNLAEYQRIIRSAARLRRVTRVRSLLDRHIRDGDADAAVALLARSGVEAPGADGGKTMRELLREVTDQIANPKPAVALGLPGLDRLTAGGLRGGEVFVLAARPGQGKSAVALQFALHVVGKGTPVAIWSLEMSDHQWIKRALSQLSRVDSQRIRTANMSEDEYRRVVVAAGQLNPLPLYFASGADTTPEGWAMEASRAVREHKAGLLVIDYLGLMDAPGGAWSRENEVATHSRTIKRTAVRLDVPVMMLHQVNRDGDDRPPALRNLRESGAIEQDADMVCFIHRDRDPDTTLLRNEGMLILAKQREGPTGIVPAYYDAHCYTFRELTDREPPEDVQRRHERSLPYAQ